jgi:hypothetical protein
MQIYRWIAVGRYETPSCGLFDQLPHPFERSFFLLETFDHWQLVLLRRIDTFDDPGQASLYSFPSQLRKIFHIHSLPFLA